MTGRNIPASIVFSGGQVFSHPKGRSYLYNLIKVIIGIPEKGIEYYSITIADTCRILGISPDIICSTHCQVRQICRECSGTISKLSFSRPVVNSRILRSTPADTSFGNCPTISGSDISANLGRDIGY